MAYSPKPSSDIVQEDNEKGRAYKRVEPRTTENNELGGY